VDYGHRTSAIWLLGELAFVLFRSHPESCLRFGQEYGRCVLFCLPSPRPTDFLLDGAHMAGWGPNRVRGAPKKNTYPILSIIEGINLETSNQVALHTTTRWLRDAHGWPTWVVNRRRNHAQTCSEKHLIIGHILLDTSFAAATSGRTYIPALSLTQNRMDQLYVP
jgi:hypothetical protein